VIREDAAGRDYGNALKQLEDEIVRLIDGPPPMMRSYLPNGSRLSCGRNARRRKEAEPQTKRLASEATQFLPTCERPPASSAC